MGVVIINIYEKINAIMEDVKSLKKDGKAEFGSTKYKYLSEAKTTAMLREQLIKHKLIILPIAVEEKREDKITIGLYTYKLVNAENPEEYIILQSGGQGHDSADKGSGKASSYAYKYLMWRTFAIPSNDDPDQIASDEIEAKENEKKSDTDIPDERTDAILAEAEATMNDAVTDEQLDMLVAVTKDMPPSTLSRLAKAYEVADLADLTRGQWAEAMEKIRKAKEKK